MEIIIIGAGGMGREVFAWISQDLRNKKDYTIKGFIDDNPNALEGYSYPIDIIGTVEDYYPAENEILVIAVLNPKIKKRILKSLIEKGAEFYSLIHPSTIIGENVSIGQGTIICPNCILTCDISIGDFVFINTSSTIGHDTTIGNYTSINGKVEITGNVVVGEKCYFGVGAKVIPKRQIGNCATIGAGSVIVRNVPENVTVFGNPAKRI